MDIIASDEEYLLLTVAMEDVRKDARNEGN